MIFVVSGIIIIINSGHPNSISSASISTASVVVGESGKLIVNFESLKKIPTDVVIAVTLPPGFTLNAGGYTTVSSPNIDGVLTLAPLSTSTLYVKRSGGSNESGLLSLVFSNVRNPIKPGVTGNFKIQFLTSSLVPSGAEYAIAPIGISGGPIELATSQNLTLPSVKYVIVISMDGLGSSYLQKQISANLAPNFKYIQDNGVYTNDARTDNDVAVTSPSHTGIVTGRALYGIGGSANQSYGHSWSFNGWPDGVNNTLAEKHGVYVPSVFDVVHDNGLRTGLYVTKDKLVTTLGTGEFGVSWNSTNGASDVTGADNGKNKIDSIYEVDHDSTAVLNKFKSDLVNNPFSYSLIHFSDTDIAGHASGWGKTAYQKAISAEDGYLGELISTIHSTPALNNNTAIIVTTDHGGHDMTHGDTNNPLDYTIPFYVFGPSNVVSRGRELYSINTSSRMNPGTGHPDYSVLKQPIRNIDSANFALNLLGLPSIVSSSADADQSLKSISTSSSAK